MKNENRDKKKVVFDQRNQKVTHQYNVDGVINFGRVQNVGDIVGQLKNIQTEVVNATKTGALDEEIAADIDANIEKAIIQSQKPEPDKNKIINYLTEAKNILANVALVAGLVKSVTEAIEIVKRLF